MAGVIKERRNGVERREEGEGQWRKAREREEC